MLTYIQSLGKIYLIEKNSQEFYFIDFNYNVYYHYCKIFFSSIIGFVGALSIVRFRSAIKDPEELTYLFLNIAIGLGLGANQPLVTIITAIVVILLS